MRTGLFINWETGSKNSNAISEFKKSNISFQYNHFGELTADFYGIGIFGKVDFEHVQGDVFEICIAQPKRSNFGASAVGWSPGSDDGRPKREKYDNIGKKISCSNYQNRIRKNTQLSGANKKVAREYKRFENKNRTTRRNRKIYIVVETARAAVLRRLATLQLMRQAG